jgi:hypothetical protein
MPRSMKDARTGARSKALSPADRAAFQYSAAVRGNAKLKR